MDFSSWPQWLIAICIVCVCGESIVSGTARKQPALVVSLLAAAWVLWMGGFWG